MDFQKIVMEADCNSPYTIHFYPMLQQDIGVCEQDTGRGFIGIPLTPTEITSKILLITHHIYKKLHISLKLPNKFLPYAGVFLKDLRTYFPIFIQVRQRGWGGLIFQMC